jgi:hypothetical protein
MGVLSPEEWRGKWITDPGLLALTRPLLGFRSTETDSEDQVRWVQVDLGSAHPLERLRLHALRHTVAEKLGFPHRFKVEVGNQADLSDAVVAADHTEQDYERWSNLIDVPLLGATGRHVRLTATRLRSFEGKACLAFSQIEVVSAGRNVALAVRDRRGRRGRSRTARACRDPTPGPTTPSFSVVSSPSARACGGRSSTSPDWANTR